MIVLAYVLAIGSYRVEQAKLAKVQTMSAQTITDHERTVLDHGYGQEVFTVGIFGVVYMLLVEVVAYVPRLGCRKQAEE